MKIRKTSYLVITLNNTKYLDMLLRLSKVCARWFFPRQSSTFSMMDFLHQPKFTVVLSRGGFRRGTPPLSGFQLPAALKCSPLILDPPLVLSSNYKKLFHKWPKSPMWVNNAQYARELQFFCALTVPS